MFREAKIQSLIIAILLPFFGSSQQSWQSLASEADSLRKSENYSESVPIYQKVLSKIKSSDQTNLNIYRVRIGLSHLNLSENENARRYFHEVIESTESDTLNDYRAHAFNNLGLVCSNEGQFIEGIQWYEKASRIYQEIGNDHMYALAMSNIGVICRKQGRYKQALEYTLQSVDVFQENNDLDRLAEAYSNIGIIQGLLGATNKAKTFYHKSISIRKSLNKPAALASTYNNIGMIHMETGDLDSAIYYFELAVPLLKTSSRRNLGMVFHNLGMTYQKMGEARQAKGYLRKALSEKKDIADTGEIIITLNELALLEFSMVDIEGLHTYLLTTRSLVSDDTSPRSLKDHFNLWKEYYKSIGNVDSALYYLEQSQDLLKQIQKTEYLEEMAFLQESFEAKGRDEQIGKLGKENKVKTKRLSEANEGIWYRNLFLGVLGSVVLLFIIVLYIRKQQQTKRELRAKILGIESEKDRISGELHDIVGSKLKKLRNRIGRIKEIEQSEDTKQFFDNIHVELTGVSSLIRKISHDLKLPDFSKGPFTVFLKDLIDDWFDHSEIFCELQFENKNQLNELRDEQKMVLYRFISECLSNVETHSKANEVCISSYADGKNCIMEIHDNGGNIQMENEPGIGHRNLSELAESIDGAFSFNLDEEGGHAVITIPRTI